MVFEVVEEVRELWDAIKANEDQQFEFEERMHAIEKKLAFLITQLHAIVPQVKTLWDIYVGRGPA